MDLLMSVLRSKMRLGLAVIHFVATCWVWEYRSSSTMFDPFLSRTVALLVGFFFASFFGQMTV